MTESREARLAEIEAQLNLKLKEFQSLFRGGDPEYFNLMGWLITELKASLDREKIMKEALEVYRDVKDIRFQKGYIASNVLDMLAKLR